MKKIIYTLFVAFIAMSCNNKNKQTTDTMEENQLSFVKKEYNIKSKLTNIPETELTADIPVAEGNDTIAKRINDAIFRTVKLIVAQEPDRSANYDELFAGFINNYEKFVSEYPDGPGAWEANIKGSVEYQTPEIVNIQIDSYTMTGGAHGNSNMTSLLFDPRNGKELAIQDIVRDTVQLYNIAEKKFREKYNVPADKPINSTGLMFLNDKFALPQNIFVTKDGLKLFYNPYEIAAYAEGTKDLTIPYGEIKDYLLISDK